MHKLMSLLLLAAVAAAGVAVGTATATIDASNSHANIMAQQPETIIDGHLNPEKIPDHEAYTILCRLIAGRETEDEKNNIRPYLRGVLGCSDCNKQKKSNLTAEIENADIDALIAAAATFDQRVSILDQQATEIQDRYHPTHLPLTYDDKERLKQLQRLRFKSHP